MSAVEIFNSIFNPLCSALVGLFTPIFSGLGISFDLNQVCVSIGDIFRMLLTDLNLTV